MHREQNYFARISPTQESCIHSKHDARMVRTWNPRRVLGMEITDYNQFLQMIN